MLFLIATLGPGVIRGESKWAKWGWVTAGGSAAYPNIGTFTVAGDRHTVKVVYDPLNTLFESNENDNVWQRQYVWTPHILTENLPMSRPAPPDPGTGTYYNCDGFGASLHTDQFWCAVGILPTSAAGNNDIRVHHDYTSSTNGFDSYHKWSANPGDDTDFCVVNRRQTVSIGPYYFGVVRRSGGAAFEIRKTCSRGGLYRTTYNGYYGIAIWKTDSADHGRTASYYLGVFEDGDQDGLPDAWEQQIVDHDPADGAQAPGDVPPGGDFDGDGSSNWAEFVARTDPTDCHSCLAIIELRWNQGGSLSLFWNCVDGVSYRIEYCDDLGDGPDWLTAGTAIVAPRTGTSEWIDDGSRTGAPPELRPNRYYRVAVAGPLLPGP